MPLDPNIFFQGAALRNANNQQLQSTIGGVVDRLYEQRKLEQDPERQLRASVARVVSGSGTPEDEALIKFESILKGGETKYMPDEFGNVRAVTQPTLYDRLYGAGGQQPYQPQYPAMGDMSVPAMDSIDVSTPKMPADISRPLSQADLSSDIFANGEKGIDLNRIAQARIDNAARVNMPAGDLVKPSEKAYIDSTAFGQKERYSADVDLNKKRQEEQMKIEMEAKKPISLEQGKVATFADRMKEADKQIASLTEAQTNLVQKGVSGVPVAGNYLTSPEFKKADQAQRNFINAVLRRESGAVISPEEFDNAKKQYFPQPGDTPEVIAQKAQNRNTVIQGFSREAGPSYKPKEENNVINWEDLP